MLHAFVCFIKEEYIIHFSVLHQKTVFVRAKQEFIGDCDGAGCGALWVGILKNERVPVGKY